MEVYFPGGKFSRRYILFSGQVEPTQDKYVKKYD